GAGRSCRCAWSGRASRSFTMSGCRSRPHQVDDGHRDHEQAEQEVAHVIAKMSVASCAASNPLGASVVPSTQSVEISAYASSAYFVHHAHVARWRLPQVINVT